jgi:hypothetical protein
MLGYTGFAENHGNERERIGADRDVCQRRVKRMARQAAP